MSGVKLIINWIIYGFEIYAPYKDDNLNIQMLNRIHNNTFIVEYWKIYSNGLVSATSLKSTEVACNSAWNEIDETTITQLDTRAPFY